MAVLDGIRVLDFGRFIAGPFCSFMLAQMGADVVRVEHPSGEDDRHAGLMAADGENFLFKVLSYCKRSITLDTQHERGRLILAELVKRADIVVESFSPKGAEIMGLDYEAVRKINPAIIQVSISGFGSTGPYRDRLSFDPVAQAMSGGMAQTGFPGTPPIRCPVRYVDYGTGMSAAYGALAALYHRQRTGAGQRVEVSLLDTALMMNGSPLSEFAGLGVERLPDGNRAYHACPGDLYKAQDGWVYFVVVGNGSFNRFLKLVGREELFTDPRFAEDTLRYEHRDVLDPIAVDWVAARSVDEAIAGLTSARLPCGPVYQSADVLRDPQVKARDMLIELDFPGAGRITVPGTHVKMSGPSEKVGLKSPGLGSANRTVYRELLQYTDDTLEDLRKNGII